ncbi:MAG: methyltransferase domain-containing protein [Burkholderiaceae bacterium]|nr:methyltransferase domain-containing protein [Burkholderiaceae bacterium]
MNSAPIDLQRVSALFSDPRKLTGSQFLRREISQRMQDKLELVKIAPHCVLDAGCGEGDDLAYLSQYFPKAHVLALDGSLAMLHLAAERQRESGGSVERLLGKWTANWSFNKRNKNFICADFSRLPLATASVDVIWSNLALHWHPQPDAIFAEWRRVLRADGLLMFSCFGPDTLIELRRAFAAVDGYSHTLPFVDMHDFGDMLVKAGFSSPVMDMEKLSLTYQQPDALFADVRALGGNPLDTRRRGLMGRDQYQRLLQGLEQGRNQEQRLPLSFEIIYGHAFRPASRSLASGESVIRLDFPSKNR